jgi:uncharacterized protein YlxW (UPF0749 family)
MKKISSQIAVALVCCILGFMLAYQFRLLSRQQTLDKVSPQNSTTDVTVEVEQYKKQKEELQKNIDDLQGKLKNYEQAAASKSDETKGMLDELENLRLLIGTETAQGPGIILYIDPISGILGNDAGGGQITDKHLIYIVNELVSAGAEAVSINDIRITPRTGITTSGNYVLVNNDRVSPTERITIKVIGDKKLLAGTIDFPGVMTDFQNISKWSFVQSDNIKINKYNSSTVFKYAKPIKK